MIKKIILLSFFCAFYALHAQCIGVTGSPVRNYTFGTGAFSTISAATSGEASTTLNYIGSACPSDGSYTVGNAIGNCFGWVVAPDHTGDTNGRMIIANLGLASSNVFTFTLNNVLCPGQAYNFSAWYTSIVKTPRQCGAAESSGLTFRIIEIDASDTPTGNTIFSSDTPLFGPLPNTATTLDWQEANNTFVVPTGGTGRYRFIIDSQFRLSTCGNDVAIDDIVIEPVTPCVSISQAPVNPVPCGNPFTLTATVNPVVDIDPVTAGNQSYTYTNPAYQWQKSTDGGATWTNITGATASTYSIANASSVDAAQYRVLVSDASSPCSTVITSPVQTVTIYGTCPTMCYRSATSGAGALETKHGITSLGRAGTDNGNWPMVRNGAWIALESKTKGFVINRLTDAQVAALPATQLKIGMAVYNTDQNCMQINTDGTPSGWKCFNTQTCPIVD